MALRTKLVEYVDRSSTLIEESPQMDEQNTKRKIIEPLIELLGWEMLSSNVELEYSVQMGSGAKKVDYALMLEDSPVIFIEAKGCDTEIEDSHRDQLRSYMRQVGVDWGLISNGHKFEIFRRDKGSTRPNEISLGQFNLETLESSYKLLKALSPTSIDSGESESIANRIEARRKAATKLRSDKEEFTQDITQLITDRVGETVSQEIEDETKTFIDNIIESLETAPSKSLEQPEQPNIGQKAGKYEIRLTRAGSVVSEFSGEIQKNVMGEMVDHLIKEENLIDQIEIPYVPGTGRGSRALLNSEPKHTDGREMRAYEKLSSGYYLYTSLSADDKKRYVSELPEKVGMDCEFVGDW